MSIEATKQTIELDVDLFEQEFTLHHVDIEEIYSVYKDIDLTLEVIDSRDFY